MQPIFMFDGSFTGYLTAVSRGQSEGYAHLKFSGAEDQNTLQLFGPDSRIETDNTKAKRIWNELGFKGTEVQKRVYYCFLHKNKDLLSDVYRYIIRQLNPELHSTAVPENAMNAELSTATREVSKEKLTLEQRMQFQQTDDGIWFAEISAEHHVLPLLSRFCRSRFHSDPWVVVDRRRNQALSAMAGGLFLSSAEQFDRPNRASTAYGNLEKQRKYTLQKIKPGVRSKEASSSGGRTQMLGRNKKWAQEIEQQAV
ncbi:DUF4130 domain-containing protein [Robiginitalea aurantiaca]|uniref:DUF4130 domain-containing protein n=1 Tax=Robiginitalea aurantiaca TaxID=3056915 RepID=A0ABT7WFK8_9FLAO|nr:DUF4130 domain-containing protein [Robiginitalea aurantiaca]MDM9631658.1 DUF4130 domain-containing protein [Robiginitalea aurantiaca]